MTDTDISEVWEAINRLSSRLDALEAAKAVQYGTMGSTGDSEPMRIVEGDTHDSGRVKYGAGMMEF